MIKAMPIEGGSLKAVQASGKDSQTRQFYKLRNKLRKAEKDSPFLKGLTQAEKEKRWRNKLRNKKKGGCNVHRRWKRQQEARERQAAFEVRRQQAKEARAANRQVEGCPEPCELPTPPAYMLARMRVSRTHPAPQRSPVTQPRSL